MKYILLLLLFLSNLSSAEIYTDKQKIFLKAEYLFMHQPITIKYKDSSSTLLSLRQKNGVAFYLANQKSVTPVIGINDTDSVDTIIFHGTDRNQIIALTSQQKNTLSGKGREYRITDFTISLDANRQIQLTQNPNRYPEWQSCFEGINAEGKSVYCQLKDAAGIRKFLKERGRK